MYRRRITRSLEGCRFKPSLRLCLFEEGYSFDLFGFLIALPFLDRYAYEPHEMMESWGAYLNGVESSWRWDSIVWCWGDYYKFFHMPWEFVHIKHEVLMPDRTCGSPKCVSQSPFNSATKLGPLADHGKAAVSVVAGSCGTAKLQSNRFDAWSRRLSKIWQNPTGILPRYLTDRRITIK